MRKIKAPIWTSYYGRVKKIPSGMTPVGISRFVPRWAGSGIARYPALAPQKEMAAEDYVAFLDTLDAQQVYADLVALGPKPVVLCFCPPGYCCHRRIFADHISDALGIACAELGFPPELIGRAHELPVKGQAEAVYEVVCDFCKKAFDVPIITATKARCPSCNKMNHLTL